MGGESKIQDGLHPSHVTRFSDASSFDEICVNCGETDIAGGGWGRLCLPCPNEPEEHRIARALDAGRAFMGSLEEM